MEMTLETNTLLKIFFNIAIELSKRLYWLESL